MQLNKVQQKFKETMLQPTADINSCDADLKDLFIDDHIAVTDRLKVYHNNIIGSLTETLRITFPLIENLVGAGFLRAMARAFIFDNPPQSGCMHLYGTGFDDFIKSYGPAKSLPYLADVATLELAMNTAYFAADDHALAPDALAKIEPDKLGDTVLNLRSSASIKSSTYPLDTIRAFCLDENIPKPDLTNPVNCHLLIHRPELEIHITPLSADEYMALELLRDQTSLGNAVEKTLQQHPDFDFAAFLQKHIALETFRAIETNTHETIRT